MEQMREKHPQRGEPLDDLAPRPAGVQPVNLAGLSQVVHRMKVLVGVGTRGLRPGHLKGLFKGRFHDLDAREAKNSFTQLGVLFLDGDMPQWLRRALAGG